MLTPFRTHNRSIELFFLPPFFPSLPSLSFAAVTFGDITV
jgi:hypothetical protein